MIRKPVIQLHPVAPASISIVEDPVNQSLSVTMLETTNPGTYQFQWQKDGKNVVDATITSGPSPRTISGALTNTLSLTPVAWLDRGSYRVIVKNEVGSVTSKSTTLKIVSPPVILSQSPSAVFGNVGGSIKLFVVAGGTSSFKYEWFYRPAVVDAEFGPTPISKSASFTLSKLTAARDGDYYCKVSNLSNPTTGSINSANIFLKVDVAPKITLQTAVVLPAPAGAAPEDYFGKTKMATGGSIRIKVEVEGTDSVENPLRYRWQFNKRDIVGAPSLPTFDLIGAPLTASGKYRCIISNHSGTTTSKELSITVQDAPAITIQPTDINQFEENKLETTAVKASGAATLRYRWEKQFSIPGGGIGWEAVAGQTSTKLSIASSDAFRDSGVYRCVVTNDVGSDTSDEIDVVIDAHPVADLDPPSGISTVEFYPSIARSGELVRIYGSNLRFTKSVKFGSISVTPTIESDNSLLVTVPAAAPLVATQLEVVSKRGSSFTGETFMRTTGFANTYLDYWSSLSFAYIANNPTIIPFKLGQYKYLGNNEFAEAVVEQGQVWYIIEVPANHKVAINVAGQKTGNFLMDPSVYLLEEGTTSGAFYLGPDGVTRFKYIASKISAVGGNHIENVAINAAATTKKYLLMVSASRNPAGNNTPYGNFIVTTTITRTATVVANKFANSSSITKQTQNITSGWTEEPAISDVSSISENPQSEEEIRFGGIAAQSEVPVEVWNTDQAMMSAPGLVRTSLNLSIERPDSIGDDQFAWQITDTNGDALLAVWINSVDGSIRMVQPDGSSLISNVILQPNGERISLEILVDTISSTWTVFVGGAPVGEPLSLAADSTFGRVSAVWDLGLDGVASGASMIFRDFKVEQTPLQ